MSISVDKAVIARLNRFGERFEILVDPKKALELRSGKTVPIDDVIASREVYEDSKKGLRAATEKVNKAFGTNNLESIVIKIVKEGEVQLTTEQRNEILEEKRKAIASIISRRGVNPQTGSPHPPERVMRAMEQAKVRIDFDKSAEEQIDYVMKAIQPIIPIRVEKVQIAIKLPANLGAKATNILRSFGTLMKEEWGSENYVALIEMSAGLQQDLYDKLNSLTHGQVETKIIKRE